jgi:hypothetical protein
MNTPSSLEFSEVLHRVAISHCKQARIQLAWVFLVSVYSDSPDAPRDMFMRDFRRVAIHGHPKNSLRTWFQNIIAEIEKGNPAFIQNILDENPGSTVDAYKTITKYMIDNLDKIDEEVKRQLETITYEEIVEIMTVPGQEGKVS